MPFMICKCGYDKTGEPKIRIRVAGREGYVINGAYPVTILEFKPNIGYIKYKIDATGRVEEFNDLTYQA